jgi:hypothetical protein
MVKIKILNFFQIVEVEQLKEKILALEQEKQEFQRLWSHETGLVNREEVSNDTTPASELAAMVAGETVSMHSTTPERFELIEAEGKNSNNNELVVQMEDEESAVSLADTDTEWTRVILPVAHDSSHNGASTPIDSSHGSLHEVAHPSIILSSPVSR